MATASAKTATVIWSAFRGGMPLAWELEDRLNDCYLKKLRNPIQPSWVHPVGGKWYCPGCGLETKEEKPGDVRCPVCSRSISEFIPSQIERHPTTMALVAGCRYQPASHIVTECRPSSDQPCSWLGGYHVSVRPRPPDNPVGHNFYCAFRRARRQSTIEASVTRTGITG